MPLAADVFAAATALLLLRYGVSTTDDQQVRIVVFNTCGLRLYPISIHVNAVTYVCFSLYISLSVNVTIIVCFSARLFLVDRRGPGLPKHAARWW